MSERHCCGSCLFRVVVGRERVGSVEGREVWTHVSRCSEASEPGLRIDDLRDWCGHYLPDAPRAVSVGGTVRA